MKPNSQEDITTLLQQWHQGDDLAMGQMMDIAYTHLKQMAHRYTVKESANYTLNTTGLVHEAYLKLLQQNNRNYQNKNHFYAILSTCMRRVVLEVARSKTAAKRGQKPSKVALKEEFVISEQDAHQVLTVNTALEKLEKFDPKLAKIVEYRYYSGFKMIEIAELMDTSLSTLKRDWRMAKSWLATELKE